MIRYVPEFVTQRDGSPCWTTQCWAAVGAWLTDGASRGRKSPTPTQFRIRAGKGGACQPGGMADWIRGLMAFEVWARGKARYDVPSEEVRRLLLQRSGKLMALETDFEDWPESSVCQPDFNDRENAYHGIGVICGEGTGANKGKVRVMQPLCMGYRWVLVSEVMQAANTYNREHREVPGTLDFVIVTPVPA